MDSEYEGTWDCEVTFEVFSEPCRQIQVKVLEQNFVYPCKIRMKRLS